MWGLLNRKTILRKQFMAKPITLCSFALSAVALSAQGYHGGAFPFRTGGPMAEESRAPVKGAPYSAIQTVQSQHVLSNGNRITRNEQMKVYRDSQGRTRTERTITPPASSGQQPFTLITIVDPVAGHR